MQFKIDLPRKLCSLKQIFKRNNVLQKRLENGDVNYICNNLASFSLTTLLIAVLWDYFPSYKSSKDRKTKPMSP